jgi:MarR family transcriptional regulator, organic hydroperoxide resistance regulator
MSKAIARTLGTSLRHLIDLLDSDVQAIYEEDGLDFRPRYTPLIKALAERQPLSIRELASTAGITHSAASQTASMMKRSGLVEQVDRTDARERAIRLTRKGKALLPKLEARWRATNIAAQELDAELSSRLTQCVEEAIAALEARPFRDRIRARERRLIKGARR